MLREESKGINAGRARRGSSFILGLGLAIVAAFLLLTCWLGVREDYWADEGFSVRRVEASWGRLYDPFSSRPPAPTDPFDKRSVYDFDPPLYFGLARVFAGDHPGKLPLRLLSILPMAATLGILTFWGLRRSRGRRGRFPGLAMGLLFALSPALIYYAEEARSYSLALFIGWAGIFLSFRFRRNARALFWVNTVAAFLGLSTHYGLGWLEVAWGAWQSIAAVRLWKTSRRNRALATAGGTLAGALCTLAAALPAHATLHAAMFQSNPPILMETVFKSLFLAFMPEVPTRAILISGGILAACWGLLFLGLLFFAMRRGWPLLLMTLWLAPVLLPMLEHWLAGMPYYPRYAIFGLPAWFLLCGWMAREATQRSRLMQSICALVLLSLLVQSAAWDAYRLQRPLRQAWTPAILELKRRCTAEDGYAISPDWTKHAFAANAQTPPAAKYEPLYAERMPIENRVWILGGARLDDSLRMRMEKEGYRMEAAAGPGEGRDGLWLWLCQKGPAR